MAGSFIVLNCGLVLSFMLQWWKDLVVPHLREVGEGGYLNYPLSVFLYVRPVSPWPECSMVMSSSNPLKDSHPRNEEQIELKFHIKMLYPIGPDVPVNQGYANFHEFEKVWVITVHVPRFRM